MPQRCRLNERHEGDFARSAPQIIFQDIDVQKIEARVTDILNCANIGSDGEFYVSNEMVNSILVATLKDKEKVVHVSAVLFDSIFFFRRCAQKAQTTQFN